MRIKEKERRSILPGVIEVRAINEGSRQAEVVCCRYNVKDDFGTVWLPGCWTDSLALKLPKIAWAHEWSEVIGQVSAFKDSDAELAMTLQFSDFDAVPRAKQAWVQLRDKDIDEFSFGFERVEVITIFPDSEDWDSGIREKMVKARMYEVSPVIAGAVPGTKVLAVRGVKQDGTIDLQQATSIAVRMAGGEIDLREALTEMKSAVETSGEVETTDKTPETPETSPGEPGSSEDGDAKDSTDKDTTKDLSADQEAVLAEAEAALAEVGIG